MVRAWALHGLAWNGGVADESPRKQPFLSKMTRIFSILKISAACLVLSACAYGVDDYEYDPQTELTHATVRTARQAADSKKAEQEAVEAVEVEGAEASQADDGVFSGPEIYPGQKLIEGGRTGPPLSTDGQVSLNFAGAEIREVIDAVLGDILGVSYVLDQRITGTVTLRTTEPLSRPAILAALESVLALNGAALVVTDGLYKVMRIEDATGFGGSVMAGAPAGYGVHVIRVGHVGADALHDILTPFVKPGRQLKVDAKNNLLIFGGPGNEAQELVELIELFDVDWMGGMSFGLFPVRVAKLDRLIADLEAVFGQEDNSLQAGAVRFLPIERMNAVLVISREQDYLNRAKSWIGRLDRGIAGPGQRIFAYPVQNGRAADLALVLREVFDVGGGTSAAPSPALFAPGANPVEVSAEGTKKAPAKRAAISGGVGEGGIKIIADEPHNTLVVLATSAQWVMVEDALQRLDIMPLQVLIEATIAEVRLNDQLKHGVEWFFESGNSQAAFSRLSSGQVLQNFPGFGYLLQTGDVRVVINALSEVTDVKVISSPQLMVLDNHSARLQVGDEVPIPIQQVTSTRDPDAPIVNSIEFRETGIILEVTPRVNASGLVMLDIVQEVSDAVRTTTSDLDAPTIRQRSISSTVAVRSGETIALGGLIADREEESEDGLPILSKIPLLGEIFKVSSKADERTELLVMITPRVVRNSVEAATVTQELRGRLKSLAPLEAKIGPQPDDDTDLDWDF